MYLLHILLIIFLFLLQGADYKSEENRLQSLCSLCEIELLNESVTDYIPTCLLIIFLNVLLIFFLFLLQDADYFLQVAQLKENYSHCVHYVRLSLSMNQLLIIFLDIC